MGRWKVRLAGVLGTLGSFLTLGVSADAQAPAAEVKKIFQSHCAKCHNSKPDAEASPDILDHAALTDKASKIVLPGNPDGSKLVKKITSTGSGVMPPRSEKDPLSAAEISTIKSWIAAGAPPFTDAAAAATPSDPLLPDAPPKGVPSVAISRPEDGSSRPNAPVVVPPIGGSEEKDDTVITKPLSSEYVLGSILNDVRKLNREERRNARYFSLAHLVVAGITKQDLQRHREALAKALNHLHWERELVQPTPIDAEQTVFRIDLRRIGWDTAVLKPKRGNAAPLNVFDLVLLEYPYGTIKTQSSTYNSLLREYLAVANPVRPIPCVNADWFVSMATQPPLYHELLFLPRTLKEFEEGIGIDAEASIDANRVVRGGMVTTSGVSHNPRVVERFQGRRGFYWRSYDFAKSSGTGNIARDPINLQPDGGEMIIQLPNGLQAYMIFSGQGTRVDVAPTSIVTDDSVPDKAVRNGLSCMRCHDKGMKTFTDVILPTVQGLGNNSGLDRRRVELLFPGQATLDQFVKADEQGFLKAMQKLLGKPQAVEPLRPVAARFLDGRIELPQAAAELGLSTSQGLERIFAREQFIKAGMLPLAGGKDIPREAWEAAYSDVARELGRGTPVVPLDGLSRPDYEPAERPFKFDAVTNKGENVFRPGEDLVLLLKADRDVFVEVVHTAANGRKTILVQGGTRMPAGRGFKTPAGKVPGKAGDKEQITILASLAPFRGGEIMQGIGVDSRLIHRFLMQERNGQVVVDSGPDPSRCIKKTITIEVK